MEYPPLPVLPARFLYTLALLQALACSSRSAPEPDARLRLWHAFNAGETEALNEALGAWPGAQRVETIQETFARGQTMLRRALGSEASCPDLARIDATWLPALVKGGLLRPMPAEVARGRQLMHAAAALAAIDGVSYGLPQAIDGLALVYRLEAVAGLESGWPPRTADELVAVAEALTTAGRAGLGVRDDGYWFVPFLRAWGGALLDPDSGRLGIDTPASRRALERFAALFGTVAPRPPAPGTEVEDERRRFGDGKLAMVVAGPWSMADLTGGDTRGIGVAALPGAPLGGQLLVVPACAAHPDHAWALAEYLTAPALQAEWAQRLGVIPTSGESLSRASPFVRSFYEALGHAQPLPRHPVTAELFDDLNPAVSRVVAGEATAAEALDSVARAWRRLLLRHGVAPEAHADAGL